MKITEIAFTGYPVTDMPRARAFYEGVLKLESSRVFGDDETQRVKYDLGTTSRDSHEENTLKYPFIDVYPC